ncbi:anthranilate synthase component I family protein [Myroides sp. LJL110]
MKYNTIYHKTLADLHTPVELYLKLRDKFANSFLLESSDYSQRENSYSYICLNPIAHFYVDKTNTVISTENAHHNFLNSDIDISQKLTQFINCLQVEKPVEIDFITNGLFGYTSYDAISLFENIELQQSEKDIAIMQYHFFRYLIVFNHYNNELYILEHLQENQQPTISAILDLIQTSSIPTYPFSKFSSQTTDLTDAEFLKTLDTAKAHCAKGDVFQLVLSREYKQKFLGDEFNVYRKLRSINPSPYLFFFDYTNFKIFGSSPEAQLIVKDSQAYIHPIAGTFKRTNDPKKDQELAIRLQNDPKECAEHVMLVDLARNDLSKNAKVVELEKFKQIESYSHVIHLVSKVKGTLDKQQNTFQIFKDTFPAGTLSGAPKTKAIQLINLYEPKSRGLYGGSVGIIGLDGTINQAIFIRSALSYNNTLYYQAGCGVVIESNLENELNEIHNKLSAIRTAIDMAQTL